MDIEPEEFAEYRIPQEPILVDEAIETLREYIKENKLSISEISARLGYSYPNHFHTAFKNYYHMTISEYKERILM